MGERLETCSTQLRWIKASTDVENIVIVGGQNELHKRMGNEEFLWLNRTKEERLMKLSENKRVAVLSPPIQEFFDPESQAREEVARASLTKLSEAGNILVWDNPIQGFEDDAGRHPSAEQTRTIVKFLEKKCREAFGVPFILDSATDDVLTTKLYAGVSSLYRFGCSGCNSRSRNRWQNLCDVCMTSLEGDELIKADAEKLEKRAEEIYDELHPGLEPAGNRDVDMEAGLVCEACNMSFKDGNELQEHFDAHHEGVTVVLPTGSRRKNKASSPLKPTDVDNVRTIKVHKNDS